MRREEPLKCWAPQHRRAEGGHDTDKTGDNCFMTTLAVESTQGGYRATYLFGLNIKLAHEVMEAAPEAELTGILTGEGVPEPQISHAVDELRQHQRTTIAFQPKRTR